MPKPSITALTPLLTVLFTSGCSNMVTSQTKPDCEYANLSVVRLNQREAQALRSGTLRTILANNLKIDRVSIAGK